MGEYTMEDDEYDECKEYVLKEIAEEYARNYPNT